MADAGAGIKIVALVQRAGSAGVDVDCNQAVQRFRGIATVVFADTDNAFALTVQFKVSVANIFAGHGYAEIVMQVNVSLSRNANIGLLVCMLQLTLRGKK